MRPGDIYFRLHTYQKLRKRQHHHPERHDPRLKGRFRLRQYRHVEPALASCNAPRSQATYCTFFPAVFANAHVAEQLTRSLGVVPLDPPCNLSAFGRIARCAHSPRSRRASRALRAAGSHDRPRETSCSVRSVRYCFAASVCGPAGPQGAHPLVHQPPLRLRIR